MPTVLTAAAAEGPPDEGVGLVGGAGAAGVDAGPGQGGDGVERGDPDSVGQLFSSMDRTIWPGAISPSRTRSEWRRGLLWLHRGRLRRLAAVQ